MSRACHRCGRRIGAGERVGRRDACLGCGSDLHCCRNCGFYDARYHNQCRETQAERQVDKEVGNFCDYFSFVDTTSSAAAGLDSTRAALAGLFGGRRAVGGGEGRGGEHRSHPDRPSGADGAAPAKRKR
jgi:hypothetical protein